MHTIYSICLSQYIVKHSLYLAWSVLELDKPGGKSLHLLKLLLYNYLVVLAKVYNFQLITTWDNPWSCVGRCGDVRVRDGEMWTGSLGQWGHQYWASPSHTWSLQPLLLIGQSPLSLSSDWLGRTIRETCADYQDWDQDKSLQPGDDHIHECLWPGYFARKWENDGSVFMQKITELNICFSIVNFLQNFQQNRFPCL